MNFFYYRSAMTEAQAVGRYLAPVQDLADAIVAELGRFCDSEEAA